MEASSAARTFKDALQRHDEQRNIRLVIERDKRHDRIERIARIRPVADAVLATMVELIGFSEYASVVGTFVEMSCDGSVPKGVPLSPGEIPRPDIWLANFPLDGTEYKYAVAPPKAIIIGIQGDLDSLGCNVWVHIADSAELEDARRSYKRLQFLFEEGTLVVQPTENAAKMIIFLLVEMVAYHYACQSVVNNHALALNGVVAA